MKIVLAIKAFARPGGAERVLADLANGLAANDHEITVLSYDAPNESTFYPLDSRVSWNALGLGNAGRPSAVLETGQRMIVMRQAIRRIRPDVVVGFMSSMYIPLGTALVGSGIPFIASEHTTRARYDSRPLERALLISMRWLARRITVVSNEVLESHPALLRRRMTVIPNPVSVQVSGFADVEGAQRTRKVLLSVGRLVESKNYAALIHAFASIADQVPNWDLRIVGEGPLRESLQKRIETLGLGKRVALPGITRAISTEYQAAQLFVLPSQFESFGLAAIEALAHGLPVVGFAQCSGVNQLVRPGYNGMLVGTDNVDALAKALMSLMNDPVQRQSLVPPTFVYPDEVLPARVVSRWEELLSECIGRPDKHRQQSQLSRCS